MWRADQLAAEEAVLAEALFHQARNLMPYQARDQTLFWLQHQAPPRDEAGLPVRVAALVWQ